MKRSGVLSLLLVLGLVVLVQTGCQQQAKTPDIATDAQKTQVTEGLPRIIFDKTVCDFGDVSPDKKYTAQFKFTNAGSGALRITDVKKCCGALLTLDKNELGPGEGGTLKVEYSSGSAGGPVSRQLRVSSNDQTSPDVTLTITARIVPKVVLQPERIELMLNKANAGCPKLTVTSLDKQPFSITSFQSTGNGITADVDPAVEATEFVLEPKVDLVKLGKRTAGLVVISLTHPELDQATIVFTILQRFKAVPSSILLLNPRPLEPEVQKVTVTSSYGEPFEIESTASEKGYAKVLSQQAVANGYWLDVEITPPARGATTGFTDMLTLQLRGGEKLPIKCSGRYLDTKK